MMSPRFPGAKPDRSPCAPANGSTRFVPCTHRAPAEGADPDDSQPVVLSLAEQMVLDAAHEVGLVRAHGLLFDSVLRGEAAAFEPSPAPAKPNPAEPAIDPDLAAIVAEAIADYDAARRDLEGSRNRVRVSIDPPGRNLVSESFRAAKRLGVLLSRVDGWPEHGRQPGGLICGGVLYLNPDDDFDTIWRFDLAKVPVLQGPGDDDRGPAPAPEPSLEDDDRGEDDAAIPPELAAAAGRLAAIVDVVAALPADVVTASHGVLDPIMQAADNRLVAALEAAGRSAVAMDGRLFSRCSSPALAERCSYPEQVTVVDLADVAGLDA